MAIQAVIDTRTQYFTDVVSEFNALGSTTTDPNGIVSYIWDFGDGSTQSGSTPYGWHRYTSTSTATVVALTVTDSIGQTATVSKTITILPSVIDTSKQLRRYITKFLDNFNSLTIDNADGNPIQVPIVWGNPDRVVAFIRGEISPGEQKRAISLPILSARLTDISPDYTRSKYNNHTRTVVDPNNQQYQILHTPTPVKMGFELGIWALNYSQAFSIIETILPWFNDSITINVGDYDYTSMNNLTLIDVQDQSTVDIGTDQRLVRYDIIFELNGYLPKNRVLSDIVTSVVTDVIIDTAVI